MSKLKYIEYDEKSKQTIYRFDGINPLGLKIYDEGKETIKVEVQEGVIDEIYQIARGYLMDDGGNVAIDFKKEVRKTLGFKNDI